MSDSNLSFDCSFITSPAVLVLERHLFIFLMMTLRHHSSSGFYLYIRTIWIVGLVFMHFISWIFCVVLASSSTVRFIL